MQDMSNWNYHKFWMNDYQAQIRKELAVIN